ncbi:MAG: type I glyceraldehyde-3-phosphate dehydrogenase [Alphaproteobacteria bacterium]|nr:type I glyceraldehyde-3-phosphate dehydrogenase [Alphaproteobacteria bacterium]
MTTRIGINGMGRIGRLVLRAILGGVQDYAFDELESIEVVHLNEVAADATATAHLLEFDSVHGRWREEIAGDGDVVMIAGRRIGFTSEGAPSDVDWASAGVDVVLECTGKFRTPEFLAPYAERGVKTVIVAAPVKEGALNVVMGVNDDLYDPAIHKVLTAASCTTNCLAPVVKVIHEEIGIRHGVITTIHDVTNTQVVVDAPHKDLRRARSSLSSLIPTTTGSATAIGLIYPELEGKLNGLAVRVPLLNASLTDCVFEVARPTTCEEVNALLQKAASGPLQGILGFEARPLVSADFINDVRSSVIDGPSTVVVDETQVKILAWYDNEMGYACRMAELVVKVATSSASGDAIRSAVGATP